MFSERNSHKLVMVVYGKSSLTKICQSYDCVDPTNESWFFHSISWIIFLSFFLWRTIWDDFHSRYHSQVTRNTVCKSILLASVFPGTICLHNNINWIDFWLCTFPFFQFPNYHKLLELQFYNWHLLCSPYRFLNVLFFSNDIECVCSFVCAKGAKNCSLYA